MHIIKLKFGTGFWGRFLRALSAIVLLPLYALEKIFLRFDSQWSWFFSAERKGNRLIRERPFDLIYVSGGASSAFLAAHRLSKKHDIPWVAEIYDQYNLVKKMGSLSDIAFKDAPIIEKTPEDAALGYQEIVLARREDFLISKKESRLPICIGNDADFETFVAERTLVNAEEDSLEIRSDQQSQDETGVFYASGSVEIERSEDLIKSDQAEFNSETGVLSAYNNVKYLRENLSINAKEGG